MSTTDLFADSADSITENVPLRTKTEIIPGGITQNQEEPHTSGCSITNQNETLDFLKPAKPTEEDIEITRLYSEPTPVIDLMREDVILKSLEDLCQQLVREQETVLEKFANTYSNTTAPVLQVTNEIGIGTEIEEIPILSRYPEDPPPPYTYTNREQPPRYYEIENLPSTQIYNSSIATSQYLSATDLLDIFATRKSRNIFFSKVYLILGFETLLVYLFTQVCVSVAILERFISGHDIIVLMAIMSLLLVEFILFSEVELRKWFPFNALMLFVLNAIIAYISAYTAAKLESYAIVYATAIGSLVFFVLSVATRLNVIDIGRRSSVFLILVSLAGLFVLAMIFVRAFKSSLVFPIVRVFFIIFLFTVYILYDTNQIIRGRRIRCHNILTLNIPRGFGVMISKQLFERSSGELYFVIEENYNVIRKKLLDKSKKRLNTWSGESENVKEKPISEFFGAINLDDSLEELNKKLMKEKEQVLIEYGKDHFERELYSYLYIDPLCPAPYNDSDSEDKKIPAQRIFAYPVQTAATFAENGDERFESWFDEQKKRNRFISKVFSILFIQLLFTASFIFLAITNGAVKEFIQEQFALIVASLAIETTVQMVIGKGRYVLSPKEHVFAALTLYTCIIDIFRILLQILANRS
ncbi:unnamed protein product [Phyllotreta striolata]|uniref:Uncharacterized protein n=1 Tax=Phyllotreta striolata TaxID=444603 RepID=A0A9N9TMJ0_PHYSR|nr:unnamed protein product [Phyllotreta striolata]